VFSIKIWNIKMAVPHATHDARLGSWRPRLVVLGSALALMVCNGPMILFPFGVLVGPITAEFGWPGATLASAVVTAHVTGALAMPIVGALMDRYGVRSVALPAICCFALGFAGMSLLPGVPVLFVVGYALLGIVGAGHSTLTYARAVSTWFDARRGLARIAGPVSQTWDRASVLRSLTAPSRVPNNRLERKLYSL
jgi:MFS family permease